MSRNINVNPDHYKTAGRERQGEALLQRAERQAYAERRAAADRWHTRQHEQAPGWETPAQPLAPPQAKRRRTARAATKRRRTGRTKPAARSSRAARSKPKAKRTSRRVRKAAVRRRVRRR
jgi:hypothetical protein